MKLNLSWGILALGEPVADIAYGRRFASNAYTGDCRDIIQTIIPANSSDNMLRALHIEEMIKLIRDVGEKPAKRNTAYEILERYY